MIRNNQHAGAYRPSVFEVTAKVAAYNKWKETLPEDQASILKGYEITLINSFKNFGESSAAELMAEILLTERKQRQILKGNDNES